MKTLVTALLLTITTTIFMFSPVYADVLPEECNDSSSSVYNSSVCIAERNGDTDPIAGKDGVIISAVRILSWVIGVASVIVVLYGGMKYITSQGDPNAIKSAKDTILYAIIGIVVAVFSQAIIIFVVQRI